MSNQAGRSAGAAAAPAAPAAQGKRSSAPAAAAQSPSKRARLQLEAPTKRAQLGQLLLPAAAAPAQSAAVQQRSDALPGKTVQRPPQQAASASTRPSAAQPLEAAVVTPYRRPDNAIQQDVPQHRSS